MADFFFDTSAVVKAYIAETGTPWVRTILDDPQHRIWISALTSPIDFTVVSADLDLNQAAQLEGIQVEDPTDH